MIASSLFSMTHPRTRAARRTRREIPTATTLVALTGLLLAGGVFTAPGAAYSGQAAGRTVSLRCKGGANACKAVVSLAGGASREKLKIALTDTDLKLKSVAARPTSIRGAYELTGGKYSLGGSLYTVTLNAVQAIPRDATLTLTFAVPRRG